MAEQRKSRSGPEAQRALEAEARMPHTAHDRAIARGLELGLPGADSIVDKTIPTFSRGELPHFAGINTFLKAPYVEDVRQCGNYDVAVVGAPFDGGTTYRSGARFGPQGMRKSPRCSGLQLRAGGGPSRVHYRVRPWGHLRHSGEHREDLRPGEQGRRSHLRRGGPAVVLGGDHSLGFPTTRGVAQHLNGGKLGILHFDRHVDTQDTDLDERMHTCPWFHATNLPNVPAENLVQIGIGGWQSPRPGVKVCRERATTIMTVTDCVEMGSKGLRRSRSKWPGMAPMRFGSPSTSTAWTRPSCRDGLARAGRLPAP